MGSGGSMPPAVDILPCCCCYPEPRPGHTEDMAGLHVHAVYMVHHCHAGDYSVLPQPQGKFACGSSSSIVGSGDNYGEHNCH